MKNMTTMASMIAITNRHLCRPDRSFEEQISYIASLGVKAIVLREKDLEESEYLSLARRIAPICMSAGIPLILHNYQLAPMQVNSPYLHLPLSKLQSLSQNERHDLSTSCKQIGTSVHSVDDAREAYALGATYLFAGNIYETDCKKGLPGKGLSYLHDVCSSVPIPVYAIGGISVDRLPEIMQAGAAGACMMSGFMQI